MPRRRRCVSRPRPHHAPPTSSSTTHGSTSATGATGQSVRLRQLRDSAEAALDDAADGDGDGDGAALTGGGGGGGAGAGGGGGGEKAVDRAAEKAGQTRAAARAARAPAEVVRALQPPYVLLVSRLVDLDPQVRARASARTLTLTLTLTL
eukprot:scaffold110966_cov48-Phaeocystis_antarctica.AAC.1